MPKISEHEEELDNKLVVNNLRLLAINNLDKMDKIDKIDDVVIEFSDRSNNLNMPKCLKKLKRRSMPVKLKSLKEHNFNTNQLNNNINEWTTKNVSDWLKLNNFEEYCESFEREDITGTCLKELTELHLKNDLNINKLGHRIKLLTLIDEQRDKSFMDRLSL